MRTKRTLRAEIAERIIRLRQQLNWSQQDLASELGTSKSVVCAWENADSAPTAWYAYRLSEVCNVSPTFLILGEEG